MAYIQPNIPIHPEGGYSLARDFFQGFFHYGNDRFQVLDPDRYLAPHRNLRDIAVRHTRVAQPILLIALKIISIATIILPLIGLFILLEQRDIRQNNNYIINPEPWNPPGGPPQGGGAAGFRAMFDRLAEPPNNLPLHLREPNEALRAHLAAQPAAPFRFGGIDLNNIAPPPAVVQPAGNARGRLAEIERRYEQYKREVDRVGAQLAPRSFKERLDLLKQVETDIERGGTDAEIYDRIQGAWFVHGENIHGIKKKKMVHGRMVELSLEEKKEVFVDQMKTKLA